MLPKRVSMGLTIGVRFIEGCKRKRAIIINEIRGRNAYPSRTTKFRTNRRLRRGWCHKIQDMRDHMPGTEPKMSCLERQSMLKNPP